MKFLLFVSTAAAASNILCADWQQYQGNSVKCSINTGCCNSQLYANSTVPQCNANPPTLDAQSAIISQETYTVAGDGTYSVELLYATGNSCPLDSSSGTIFFRHVTTGTYAIVGNNSDVTGGWTKVQYHPQSFTTNVVKSNQPGPFQAGVFVSALNKSLSPCMQLQDYLNNPAVGCPCNGTWTVNSPRAINSSACPVLSSNSTSNINATNATNATQSTCPEANFFNTFLKYGNVRVTNTNDTSCAGGNNFVGNSTNGTYTNGTYGCRILEITQPNTDSTFGFNNSVVYAAFIANQTCPSTIISSNNTAVPTPAGAHYNSAGRATLTAVFSLAVAWSFFLGL